MTVLDRLGFSVSYDEVTRYKQSVVTNENVSQFLKDNLIDGFFGQWSADNVDHNFCTVDGKRTLHGMGLVISTTPATNSFGLKPIKRQKIRHAQDVVSNTGIPILQYYPSEDLGLSSVTLKPIVELMMANSLPEELIYDNIWHLSHFHPNPRPSWSGYMSKATSGEYPGQSTVSLLPIIDLNPNDMSCIYSTLKFVESQSRSLVINTPVITFDQPLWIKAIEIIKVKSLHMVCMLGGFHLLMSFMGSIGSLMKSSGLEDAIEQIYAKNTVPHIISGKAISRAIRAHFLVESALVSKLMTPLVGPGVDKVSVEELKADLDLIMTGFAEKQSRVPIDLEKYPSIAELLNRFEESKDDLSQTSRTAKFWIQYVDYIGIVKNFIRAERMGDWNLYLFAISRMIDLFVATSHVHYAKGARLYLQNMLDLKFTHSWVHNQFVIGRLHTVRRSDKFWAGLWSDLIIEQVMMRSIKSNGGLTTGRGISESTRRLWLGSIHRSAAIHNAMGELTGAVRKTSEQHVQLTSSVISLDAKDFQTVKDWFEIHEPFSKSEPDLKSLSSGLIGGVDVNCDEADKAGREIQKKLDNINMEEATIPRKERVKTFEDLLPAIKIGDSSVIISPSILFSRLTALVNFSKETGENFQFELTPEPTSLFKWGIMRKPAKSVLRNHFVKTENACNMERYDACVVDGGALLHNIYWPKTTYSAVIEQYVDFMKKKYQKYVSDTVAFDGYEDDISTKSVEHSRRMAKSSATLKVSEGTKVTCSRELFLANPSNKDQLIKLLCREFEKAGFKTKQSEGDADVLIVETCMEYVEAGRDVVVSADDTDIFILMMNHWHEGIGEMFFSTDMAENKKRKPTTKFWKLSEISSSYDHQNLLLFAHAWCGCDTTSAIHQKG